MKEVGPISESLAECFRSLERNGQQVQTARWQGVKPPAPMLEVVHHTFTAFIPGTVEELQVETRANQPWAENHFRERIGGEPLNPGHEYKNWPFFRGNVPKHQTEQGEAFTHTYMERIWPKWAGPQHQPDNPPRQGIRYPYGDMGDVLNLLEREPDTRQAYLPIWFPEDTGATHGGRVPCTLGYHWMLRDEALHCMYPIRSCDIIRHLPDDIYLACRKTQWIIEQMRERKVEEFRDAVPGDLTMVFGSLHCWANERNILLRKAKEYAANS